MIFPAEEERLAALMRYAILDTDREEPFDAIAWMAAHHFRTPIATVTFVDKARQWFKSVLGLNVRETSRNVAFCHYAIQQDEVLVVPDALADPRFATNPLVIAEPHMRFYAGAPLVTIDGHRLGTVAVIDTQPRPDLGPADRKFLQHLAGTVIHELEMRRAAQGYVLEIGARKAIESKLWETTERLQLTLDAAGAATWQYDVMTDRLTYSPEAFVLHGLDPERPPATASEWLEMVHEDDRAAAREAFLSLPLVPGQRFAVEFRVRHPEKGVRWIASQGRVAEGPGRRKRLVGLNFDVTERRAIEEALADAKRQADHANQAKSRFLASASHDLRQPVQSIMLYASILAPQLEGVSQRVVLGHVEKAALALKTMLDGLLDISRLDAGVIVPELRPVALAPLLDQLGSEFRLQGCEKGVEVRVVPTSLWVRTDPALLEQVLRNLVANAVKYTSAGRVLVGCRRGRPARICIGDTGVGIPADQLAEIFEEFHQLDNPARDRSRGIGLGLAIVQRLTRLLHHRLEVRSQPGRGSLFTLRVPTACPVADESEAPPVRSGAGLVVVAEDEADLRSGLKLLLEGWGYEVIAGKDHRDIIPALGTRRPLLAVADYQLGGSLTGIEVLRLIQSAVDHPVRGVLLTGDTAPERVAEARRSGFEVLHKPITATALRAFLQRQRVRAGN